MHRDKLTLKKNHEIEHDGVKSNLEKVSQVP